MSGYVPSTDRTLVILPDSETVFRVGLPTFPPKSPVDVLDFTFDWTRWFCDEPGDSIVTAEVTYQPTGMDNLQPVLVSGCAVSFWPSAGAVPIRYTANCELQTAFGRQVVRSGTIYVINR